MSVAGNQYFTNVVNAAGQFSNLNAASGDVNVDNLVAEYALATKSGNVGRLYTVVGYSPAEFNSGSSATTLFYFLTTPGTAAPTDVAGVNSNALILPSGAQIVFANLNSRLGSTTQLTGNITGVAPVTGGDGTTPGVTPAAVGQTVFNTAVNTEIVKGTSTVETLPVKVAANALGSSGTSTTAGTAPVSVASGTQIMAFEASAANTVALVSPGLVLTLQYTWMAQ